MHKQYMWPSFSVCEPNTLYLGFTCNVRESEGRLDTDCLPGSQVIVAWKIVYKAILIFFLLETCNKSCFIYYRGNSASQSLTFLNKIPPLGLKEN